MFAEAKLVYVTEDELTMLKDVIGVDVFDGVVDSVDMRVAVSEQAYPHWLST
jgi:hypothetical protein